MIVMKDQKKPIEEALEQDALQEILTLDISRRKLVGILTRLSYDKETLVGRRAIKAMGIVAREMVTTDQKFLRETCRKLLWSLNDESGGIGWSAPELLGEIVSADPARFTDVIPLIAEAYLVEEDVFRSGVVYALARIAETHPGLVLGQQRIIISSLVDKDPQVRAYGLRLAGLLWQEAVRSNAWTAEYQRKIKETVRQLKNDKSDAWIYKDSGFISVLVMDYAIDAESNFK